MHRCQSYRRVRRRCGHVTSPYAENFGVRFLVGSDGLGARTVKGINLDPADNMKYSNVSGNITGDLDGTLLLQRSSGGTGGYIGTLIIGDDVAWRGDFVRPRSAR